MINGENLPVLLHLETAEQGCSVALSRGEELVYTSFDEHSFQQTSQLPILIKEAFEQQHLQWDQVCGVSICDGPGSYTALRVGASMAKAICYAYHLPLIAIPTLDLVFQSMLKTVAEEIYVTTLDARRERVFYALYDASGALLAGPDISRIDHLIEQLEVSPVRVGGSGLLNHPELWVHVEKRIVRDAGRYSAAHMILPAYKRYVQGIVEDLNAYAPNYLLSPNITKQKAAR